MALAALTFLLIVVAFVAAAATNAVVFSVVVSMTAAGGFLAVLLALLAAVYVCALSAAVFMISATTIATVVAVTIATGTPFETAVMQLRSDLPLCKLQIVSLAAGINADLNCAFGVRFRMGCILLGCLVCRKRMPQPDD